MEKQERQGSYIDDGFLQEHISGDDAEELGIVGADEMMEDGEEVQWKVCAEEEVAAPAERVWEMVSQFCSAHVWCASLETCEKLEGEERVAGCVRLCEGSSDFSSARASAGSEIPSTLSPAMKNMNSACSADPAPPDVVHELTDQLLPPCMINWSKEKLLLVDDAGMVLSYDMLDSNLGLRGYSATLEVLRGTSTSRCRLRWTALLEPVPFTSQDRISDILQQLFRRNVQKLRQIVCPS